MKTTSRILILSATLLSASAIAATHVQAYGSTHTEAYRALQKKANNNPLRNIQCKKIWSAPVWSCSGTY